MTPDLDIDVSARLEGVRVAVTGGTSGLGLALVREFLGRGARVAFVARTRARVDAVARAHPAAYGIVGDVARKEDIHPIALQIVGNLGGLDVLVNNASSLGPTPLALLGDTECEELELALATNVLGPFRLTRALLGSLAASARAGRGSAVLNVSSDAAINAYPRWGAYGASKAALHHLSRIWHEELDAEGVRVLSLDPGDMDTPLHALAVPDADPATLKPPERAARELADAVAAALPGAHWPLAVRAERPGHDRGRSTGATAAGRQAAHRRRRRPHHARATIAVRRLPGPWRSGDRERRGARCRRACTACTCGVDHRSRCGWRDEPHSPRTTSTPSRRSSSVRAIFMCGLKIARCHRRLQAAIVLRSVRSRRRWNATSGIHASWRCASTARRARCGRGSRTTAVPSSMRTSPRRS